MHFALDMSSYDASDLEVVPLDEDDVLWPEPTVLPALRTSVGFSRDLAIDVEDVGSDFYGRATETPPHVHLLGALLWFAD